MSDTTQGSMNLDPPEDTPNAQPPEPTPPVVPSGPLPDIGDMVLFWPRAGDVRRGRTREPALVIWRHEAERLLDLVVVREANDVINQERVPERVGSDRGWTVKEPINADPVDDPFAEEPGEDVEALRSEVGDLRKVLLGEIEAPVAPVLELIDALDERLDKLERARDDGKAVLGAKAAKPAKPAKPAKGKKRK